MPYTYNATCSGCGFSQQEFLTHLSRWAYLFPDGQIHRVLAKPAWCERCGQIVHAEDLPSVDEIEEKAVRLPFYKWNLEWLVAWRSTRQSPGKCLSCGSDKIALARDVSRQELMIPHPKCGGQVSLLISRHATASLPVNCELFTPEGEALGRQTLIAE